MVMNQQNCRSNECGDSLATLTTERPRLMATRAAIARSQAIIERNDTAKEWQAEIARRADYMLSLPPLTPTSALDPAESEAAPLPLVRPVQSAGGMATPLDIARRFGLRIQTLGMTWFLSGDNRYRDRAAAELLAICNFPDWLGDEFLVTAEMAFGAGVGFDWLCNSLNDSQRHQVIAAILDKAIQPGLDQLLRWPPPPQRWATASTNWNLVCNGGLIIAALSIAEADPRAIRLVSLARASVRSGFNGYSPDGGWAEGPGYWHYATQYAIYLLDSLQTALGSDLGLSSGLGLSRTGLFRLHMAGPSGKLFNFADSEEKHSGGYWLFWLARRYKHPIDAWTELHRGKVHPMDLLWFDENHYDPLHLPRAKKFRGAEVMTLRGGWNPNDCFLGIKGGGNDSCRHAHFDLGSFVFDALGVRWAVDLGPDNYALAGYFDREMRARYYRTSTIGHNTLVFDGECQPPTADAPIVRSRFRANMSVGVIDLTEAYPTAARVLRGFALIAGQHAVIVDEIVPNEKLS
ncbi:MAG: heparinase II/III family protein, partial [Alphaproteobacteria bacterium]|nr:heparinase II/III family protein [Alphaproteobacteria bacterium]